MRAYLMKYMSTPFTDVSSFTACVKSGLPIHITFIYSSFPLVFMFYV